MYYIYDYATGNVHQFTTKEELILWWKKNVGKHNFDELNVSGSDCHMTEPGTYYHEKLGTYIITYNKLPVPVMKRYVILDKNGRHIDIREWDKELWAYKKPCKSIKELYPNLYSGKKYKRRHIKGASFSHRDNKTYVSLEDEDLPDNIHITAITKSRPLSNIQAWDCAEKRMINKGRTPRCWKDQTKCDRQYARHKNGKSSYSDIRPKYDTCDEDLQLADILRTVDCATVTDNISA